MDPEVWSNLPPNLTLEIYKKLPMQSFYQLREVCKDWNSVARERRCVSAAIHKPYFVLIQQGDYDIREIDDEETDDEETDDEDIDDLVEESDDYDLHGILTFHIKSGSWRWQKLHPISFNHDWLYMCPFSVKGLTFSCDSPKSHRNYRVFDTHTRKRYTIPQLPKISKLSRALGMTVDTSVVPHTFKIILGSLDIGTQIYDSVTESWETRASLLVPCWEPRPIKACVHCGNHMYIWSEPTKIFAYSLEQDKWSTLNPPPTYDGRATMVLTIWRGLGSWQGRIFAVASDGRGTSIAPLLWIWELVDPCEQTRWECVAEMPGDMQSWLMPRRLHVHEDVQVFSSFCDELVLVYSWVPQNERAYRFVLYNLVTKRWEKVEAPTRSVSIASDCERDTAQSAGILRAAWQRK